jgi:hypothetical protein
MKAGAGQVGVTGSRWMASGALDGVGALNLAPGEGNLSGFIAI